VADLPYSLFIEW